MRKNEVHPEKARKGKQHARHSKQSDDSALEDTNPTHVEPNTAAGRQKDVLDSPIQSELDNSPHKRKHSRKKQRENVQDSKKNSADDDNGLANVPKARVRKHSVELGQGHLKLSGPPDEKSPRNSNQHGQVHRKLSGPTDEKSPRNSNQDGQVHLKLSGATDEKSPRNSNQDGQVHLKLSGATDEKSPRNSNQDGQVETLEGHKKKHSASSDNEDHPKRTQPVPKGTHRRRSATSEHKVQRTPKTSLGTETDALPLEPTQGQVEKHPKKLSDPIKHEEERVENTQKPPKKSTDSGTNPEKLVIVDKGVVTDEAPLKRSHSDPGKYNVASAPNKSNPSELEQQKIEKHNKKISLGPVPLFLPKHKVLPPEVRKNPRNETKLAPEKPKQHLASHANITPVLFQQNAFWKPDPNVHVLAKLVEHDTGHEPKSNADDPNHYTLPGLDFLEPTVELNFFMRPQRLDCDNFEILLSSYNVLNEKGETIYFIAENQQRCYCHAPWSHYLPIYSVTGDLIMVVLKRNIGHCNFHAKAYKKMKEVKQILAADSIIDGKKEKYCRPCYHIYHPSSGGFVGHFKENVFSGLDESQVYTYKYTLYDGNYNVIHFIDKIRPPHRAEVQEGDIFDPDRLPFYRIYRGHTECGMIHNRADLRRLGIKASPETCYHAEYPEDLPVINKAILMGFVAVTQLETVPVDQDCCTACCIVTCCGGGCTIS